MAAASRIVAGFILAPVAPTLFLALVLSADGQYLQMLMLTGIVAYGLTLVFGLPTFLWLRILPGGLNLKRVLACSFFVGMVPLTLLGLMAPSSSTANPLWEIVAFPALIGLLSSAGGAIFWRITSSVFVMPEGSEREV
jgi:hypothetical protein